MSYIEPTLTERQLQLMTRRAMDNVGKGYSYETAIRKVQVRHRLEWADANVIAIRVFNLAAKRKQLTRAEAQKRLEHWWRA